MSNHRDTCISRLTELAEDPNLRAHVIKALCVGNETRNLSLAVQYVLEERDRQVDNVLFSAARDLKEPYDPRD